MCLRAHEFANIGLCKCVFGCVRVWRKNTKFKLHLNCMSGYDNEGNEFRV